MDPWQSIKSKSPGLSSVSIKRSGNSPIRRENSNQALPTSLLGGSSTNPMYFSVPPNSSNQIASRMPSGFMASDLRNTNGMNRSSRHNSDEESRYATRPMALGGSDSGFSTQLSRQNTRNSTAEFNSSVASRSGSLPPSRNEMDPQNRYEDLSNIPYSHFIQQSPTTFHHQPTLSPQNLSFQKGPFQSSRHAQQGSHVSLDNLGADFGSLNISKDNQSHFTGPKDAHYSAQGSFSYEQAPQIEPGGTVGAWDTEDNSYDQLSEAYRPATFVPGGTLPPQVQYRGSAFNTSSAHTPTSSDARQSQHSPYYSTGGTPPHALKNPAASRSNFNGNFATGQALMLEKKLRGLQQEQNFMQTTPNGIHFRPPITNSFEVHPQNALRMNPLNTYYPIPPVPGLLAPQNIPRGPARGRDAGQHARSALLEKFKSDPKAQKTFELKVCAT